MFIAPNTIAWDGTSFYCAPGVAPAVPSCPLNQDFSWNGSAFVCRDNTAARCVAMGGVDGQVDPSWIGREGLCVSMATARYARAPNCALAKSQIHFGTICEWDCATTIP
jgi:hypothetical protein